MFNKTQVIAGIVIFVVLITFPFWINRGKVAPTPELKLTEKAKKAKECIVPKASMKATHMQILDIWRNSVVRDADRKYVTIEGMVFDMCLSNTCLDCHSNKSEFCDKCHNYVSVKPYCWDCHIDDLKEINK